MIEVKDVYFTYPPNTEALSGVSCVINDGEFVAIMGENGAGKTTLVKHFNGILKPTKGDVFVNNINTRKVSVARLSREVGIVFQNPDHQLFSETVEEEIAFGLRNFGFRDEEVSERISWVLGLLGLEKYRKASPFMLSGGERKRVALAAVLAWDPKVIVLDEPTIGQDQAQKERLRQFIMKVNSEGKTVIVVTHDVEFVADCSPRVILMSRGKIVSDGSACEIFNDSSLMSMASIAPPQLTMLLRHLLDLGLPQNVLRIDDIKELLTSLLRVKERI